jgi:ATP-dependent RNA helicase RhlE
MTGASRAMKDSALTSFQALSLAEPITRALVDEQYATPTPIQAQTIPQVLAGRDVVGIAQTGTGKTAAFALPILNHLSKDRKRPEQRTCRVLVLSPTRELSAQIVESFETYGRYLHPRVALAIGGVPLNKQIRACAGGLDVLVATPGRLLDLMQQRAIQLDKVEVFVLDEADRMLDMGFIHDIRRIVTKLPSKRQTLFFSATMPKEIADLANHMLRDPVRVAVTPAATTVERVEQRLMHVDRGGKQALLAEILRAETIDRVLVFTRTKRGADKVVSGLAKSGLTAEAIHGNKSQGQRERALAGFRAGKVRTLVATDIAARGIDVDGISHVINFDLPNIPESYVHRIGRTARAGADGIAISFCDHEERAYLRDIEKLIRMSIPATDRRGERPAAPEPRANGAADARPPRQQQHGRGRQQQERRADHNNGAHRSAANGAKAHGGRAHGGNGHGHKPHAAKPHAAKLHDTKPHAPAASQGRGNGSAPHHRAEQGAAGHEPGIGSVPFMQTPRRPSRPHAARHVSR